jgi:hypothetical protein
MMGLLWIDRAETRTERAKGGASLEIRIADLERRVAGLSEWLATVADESLTRAGVGALCEECD